MTCFLASGSIFYVTFLHFMNIIIFLSSSEIEPIGKHEENMISNVIGKHDFNVE